MFVFITKVKSIFRLGPLL